MSVIERRSRPAGLLLVLVVSLWAGAAAAADATFFSGAEFDTQGQGFSFVAGDLTQKIQSHLGLTVRLMPNYLTYKYRSDGELVHASSPGGYLLAGVKLFLGETTVSLFGGADVRHTDLSPDVRSAAVRGDSVAPMAQGELDTWLPSRTNLNLFSSFSATDDFLYLQATAKQQVTNLDFAGPNTLNVGVQVIHGSNENFESHAVGLVLELYRIPASLSLSVRAGWKHDSTFGTGAYGGIGLSVGF